MHLLGIAAIIYTVFQLAKESCEKTIPAENWANMDLWQEDVIKGVPIEQRMKNLENGKYNPSLKLAMDIAKVFEKSVEEIFRFEESDKDR